MNNILEQEPIGLRFICDSGSYRTKGGQRIKKAMVQCRCGKIFEIIKANYTRRPFSTCGCFVPKNFHGFRGTPIYNRWDGMIQRCRNPKNQAYNNYGGRGIKVCEEWSSFIAFKEWADSSGFEEHLELDRIDNNKGYSPDNCRWVTHSQNNRNTRRNRILYYNGEGKTIAEWAEITGLSFKCIQSRVGLLKWDVAKALTTPTRTIKHTANV